MTSCLPSWSCSSTMPGMELEAFEDCLNYPSLFQYYLACHVFCEPWSCVCMSWLSEGNPSTRCPFHSHWPPFIALTALALTGSWDSPSSSSSSSLHGDLQHDVLPAKHLLPDSFCMTAVSLGSQRNAPCESLPVSHLQGVTYSSRFLAASSPSEPPAEQHLV